MKKQFKVIEKNSFSNFDFKDYFLLIYFIVVAALAPIIVSISEVATSTSEMELFIIQPKIQDIFAYGKSLLILIFTVIAIFCYGAHFFVNMDKYDFKRFKKTVGKPYVIALLIFVLAAILSTIFSIYNTISIFGIWQRYEGLLVLLCYVFIFFAALDFCRSKFTVNILLIIICLSALVIGIIGTFQILGKDFFQTVLASKLVYGKYYYEGAGFIVRFPDKVYTTLYNPNSVGIYADLLLPVFLGAGIFYKSKTVIKYLFLFTSFTTIMILFGSRSAASVFGFAVMTCVFIAMVIKCVLKFHVKFNKKIFVVLASLAVGFVVFSFTPFVQKAAGEMVIKFTTSATVNPNFFTDWEIKDNYTNIFMNDKFLHVEYNKNIGEIELSYDAGTVLKPDEIKMNESNKGRIAKYNIPEVGVVELKILNNMLALYNRGIEFKIYVEKDGTFKAMNREFKPVDLYAPVPSVGFKGIELFGSGRGYIWSRSIPLLKDTLILGTGPDTFPFDFPQRDMLGKTRYLGNPDIVVDKPHNFYLQQGINTGVISLLALVVLFAIYLITTLKTVFNDFENDKYIFGVKFGLFIGMVGYFISSCSTDSSISVSPVFWTLLGMGYAINIYFVNINDSPKK